MTNFTLKYLWKLHIATVLLLVSFLAAQGEKFQFIASFEIGRQAPKEFLLREVLYAKRNIVLLETSSFPNAESALQELRRSDGLRYAQFNHLLRDRVIPDDLAFGYQWNMLNDGTNGHVADADIDAEEAWDVSVGGQNALEHDIVVAIVDGGCDLDHEDLADNIWVNSGEIPDNNIDDDGNGYIDDINGWDAGSDTGDLYQNSSHGTHVSGIVGAVGNNFSGFAGVNWTVKLLQIERGLLNTSNIIRAYNYVATQKSIYLESNGLAGANVVSTNNSFGRDQADCDSGEYPVWNDLYDSMGELGILSACATANAHWNIDEVGDVPTGCSSDFVLSVTNSNSQDQPHYSAGYGVESIDISAPGTEIWSTDRYNGVSQKTGTSMSTPHVAGAVALMHAAADSTFAEYAIATPQHSARILKQILFWSADTLPAFEEINMVSGRMNLARAVQRISDSCQGVSEGDINASGDTDVTDLVMLIEEILHPQLLPKFFIATDFNQDAELDISDAVTLIDFILNE